MEINYELNIVSQACKSKCNKWDRGCSSWSHCLTQFKALRGRNERGVKSYCSVSASLKTSMHHLFLQPSAAVAWPAPHHPTVSFWHPGRSIKTIFLVFMLFADILNRPWMSTVLRIVATGRVILFQSQTVCTFKSSSAKATLIYVSCLLHPVWHSKVLGQHKHVFLIRCHPCIIGISFCYWPFIQTTSETPAVSMCDSSKLKCSGTTLKKKNQV